MEKITKGTIVRTVVLFLALGNHALTIAGHSPLPFDDVMIEQIIAFGFDTVASIVAWWKDNDFTKRSRTMKAIARSIGGEEE